MEQITNHMTVRKQMDRILERQREALLDRDPLGLCLEASDNMVEQLHAVQTIDFREQ